MYECCTQLLNNCRVNQINNNYKLFYIYNQTIFTKWHRVVMYVGHHVQDKSVGKRKGEARGILYGGVHLVTH